MVPASAIVVIDGFKARPVTHPTLGRDTNAILREVFGTPERPEAERIEIEAIRALIEDGSFPAARERLDALASRLSEEDGDVLGLRMHLHVTETDRDAAQ